VAAVSQASAIVVRRARAADVAALTRLAGELGDASEEAQMKRRFARVTSDTQNRVFVAEDSDSNVIGWVQVRCSRELAVEPRGEVTGLIVTSAARGRGAGRQLMEVAELWTKQQGGSLLSLRSNIVRKEAHVFYERLGYTVTKTSLNFSKLL